MAIDSDATSIRPAGSGPEFLENEPWPSVPVLLLGAEGTGRKTWADYLMTQHQALEEFVVRSESTPWSFKKLTGWLKAIHFATDQTVPRWASISLDNVSRDYQNTLLSLAEDLPAGCRLLLRSTPDSVAPTLKTRCFVVKISPPSLSETVELLVAQGVRRNEAEEAAELRSGRPGLALQVIENLPFKNHFRGILNAVDARDNAALSATLMVCSDEIRFWFVEWVNSSLALRPMSHPRLAREAGTNLLEKCLDYLEEVPNPRLAVRAAATLLMVR